MQGRSGSFTVCGCRGRQMDTFMMGVLGSFLEATESIEILIMNGY